MLYYEDEISSLSESIKRKASLVWDNNVLDNFKLKWLVENLEEFGLVCKFVKTSEGFTLVRVSGLGDRLSFYIITRKVLFNGDKTRVSEVISDRGSLKSGDDYLITIVYPTVRFTDDAGKLRNLPSFDFKFSVDRDKVFNSYYFDSIPELPNGYYLTLTLETVRELWLYSIEEALVYLNDMNYAHQRYYLNEAHLRYCDLLENWDIAFRNITEFSFRDFTSCYKRDLVTASGENIVEYFYTLHEVRSGTAVVGLVARGEGNLYNSMGIFRADTFIADGSTTFQGFEVDVVVYSLSEVSSLYVKCDASENLACLKDGLDSYIKHNGVTLDSRVVFGPNLNFRSDINRVTMEIVADTVFKPKVNLLELNGITPKQIYSKISNSLSTVLRSIASSHYSHDITLSTLLGHLKYGNFSYEVVGSSGKGVILKLTYNLGISGVPDPYVFYALRGKRESGKNSKFDSFSLDDNVAGYLTFSPVVVSPVLYSNVPDTLRGKVQPFHLEDTMLELKMVEDDWDDEPVMVEAGVPFSGYFDFSAFSDSLSGRYYYGKINLIDHEVSERYTYEDWYNYSESKRHRLIEDYRYHWLFDCVNDMFRFTLSDVYRGGLVMEYATLFEQFKSFKVPNQSLPVQLQLIKSFDDFMNFEFKSSFTRRLYVDGDVKVLETFYPILKLSNNLGVMGIVVRGKNKLVDSYNGLTGVRKFKTLKGEVFEAPDVEIVFYSLEEFSDTYEKGGVLKEPVILTKEVLKCFFGGLVCSSSTLDAERHDKFYEWGYKLRDEGSSVVDYGVTW